MDIEKIMREHQFLFWLAAIILSWIGSPVFRFLRAFVTTSPRKLSKWIDAASLKSANSRLNTLNRYHELSQKQLLIQIAIDFSLHFVAIGIIVLVSLANAYTGGPPISHGMDPAPLTQIDGTPWPPREFSVEMLLTFLNFGFLIALVVSYKYVNFLRSLLDYEETRDKLSEKIAILERGINGKKLTAKTGY